VAQFLGQPFDYVITVCDRARKTCPVFPGQHNSLHWGLDDPAEAEGTEADKLDAFRRTRNEVAVRLRPFVELARKAGRAPSLPDAGAQVWGRPSATGWRYTNHCCNNVC
jgi:arsenate reductase